jgi:hypothetical protein
VLGGVAGFEKTTLVAKLKAARDRKKKATGKCGGRKTHAERRPDVVALAKALARQKPKGGQLSLRAISAELEAQSLASRKEERHGNIDGSVRRAVELSAGSRRLSDERLA